MYRILAIIIGVFALAAFGAQAYGDGTVTAKSVIFLAIGISIAFYLLFLERLRCKHTERLHGAAACDAAEHLIQCAADRIPTTFSHLLDYVECDLRNSGYIISRNVSLSSWLTVDLIASHLELSLPGMITVPVFQHLVIQHLKQAAAEDFSKLFNSSHQYARRTYGTSLLRGRYAAHVILPCIVVDELTADAVTFAKGKPPRKWFKFEFPVLYNLSTNNAYYYCGPRLVRGNVFAPGARALAQLAFGQASSRG